ncbi:MAG: hypothetical protein FVQ85_17850 [Planctomycetes bacterium]|nr:hypothetical protein [Planctomycetota bacterium]
MKVKSILLSAIVISILLAQVTFAALPRYEIIDLGPGWASGINDAGQVVGGVLIYGGYTRAFLWDKTTGMTDLGVLGGIWANATGVNDAGQVTGWSSTGGGEHHAFLWGKTRGMIDLGTLPGYANSRAWSINNTGQVVGESNVTAFLWEDGDMIDLGTLGGSTSYAKAINNVGQVVGSSSSGQGSHAFLWDSINGMRDLGVLPSSYSNSSSAHSINDSGQIVGISGGENVFLWEDGEMTDLGTLGQYSEFCTINDAGQVVGGAAYQEGEYYPFYWDAEIGMIRLDELVLSNRGWKRLELALDINNRGQIVGYGLSEEWVNHAFVMTPVPPKIIYVDADAEGANDGSSWADAYNFLQDALTAAWSGDEIHVAQGTYKTDQGAEITPGDREATFQLKNGVTLKGGYAGTGTPDPNARDFELYETIITGDLNGNDVDVNDPRDLLNDPCRAENSYHVVTARETDETAILDGFTITAGNADGFYVDQHDSGGGMYNLYYSSPTVKNCTFSSNSAYTGGGMSTGGRPKVSRCTFIGNSAGGSGGGMLNLASTTFIHCSFIGNTSGSNGGGVWNWENSPIFVNCVFNGNEADVGGGAVWNVDGGGGTFINCTLSSNKAVRQGGAIFSDVWPNITNCILWGNRDSGGVSELTHVYAEVDERWVPNYSCIQGWTGDLGGIGNTGEDPLFVETDGADNVTGTEDDDLRLLAGSACLDAGDNSALPPSVLTDIDGNPRFINGTVDMGAHEGPNQGFLLSTESVTIPEGRKAEFSVALAMDPRETVEVTVAHGSGDRDIKVKPPDLLIFDSSNYRESQVVKLTAAQDKDYLHGQALISISAAGFVTTSVTATELDDEAPTVLYVDSSAPGASDGTTWTDAFTRLQDALRVAEVVPEVEELRVAQGIYKPDQGNGFTPGDRKATFKLLNGLAIKGGYPRFDELDPDARDIDLYETILSGDLNGDDVEAAYARELSAEPSRSENSWHVLTSQQYTDKTSVLDGFTVTGGNADGPYPDNWGGGMYNGWNSNPTLNNCTFSSNSAQYGGGMYNASWSSPAINNCTFSRNLATGKYADGGGIYNNRDNSPILTNCTFSGNCAEATWNTSGGGMWNGSGRPTLIRCTFSGNSALGEWGRGGAIYNESRSTTLTNCMFSGNVAGLAGGGIYSRNYSNATMTNCTFSDNSANFGRALACDSFYSPSDIRVNSSIIWDGGNEIWNNDNSTITITYSDIQNGWPGEGNIDADPLFVNEDNRDYHLLEDSLCIDAGDPNYLAEPNKTDLDGKPRIVGGRIDMGAYEYNPTIPAQAKIIPRTINLASKGKWITCYIRLPEGYNVADIDPNSVLLEEQIKAEQFSVNEQQQVATARFSREEVQSILDIGEVEMIITGQLKDGNIFKATDIVQVTDRGGGK